MKIIQSKPAPIKMTLESWSRPHNISSKGQTQAIFTSALAVTYIGLDVRNFVGTARRTGFTGDIGIKLLLFLFLLLLLLLLLLNFIF